MLNTNNIELLVSLINTKLRDEFDSLISLCEDEDIDYNELISKLESNGYYYNEEVNQIKIR